MTVNPNFWSFGAEHEWGDLPRNRFLPLGFGWDERDCTIVNSNGIANCPKGKFYHLGGEINTPPTNTIDGQVGCLLQLKEHFPEAVCNYRSNLHGHIRVPGLRDDLRQLKRLAMYNRYWLPKVLPIIEPIPHPQLGETKAVGVDKLYSGRCLTNAEEFAHLGALRRYRRRKRSHHTILTEARTQMQLAANTVDEFFEREVPRSAAGKPMWHAQPRAAVNLRQLRETDTVEFRHAPGTLDPNELRYFLEWCEHYLLCALCPTWGLQPEALNPLHEFKSELRQEKLRGFPTFPPYDHRLEIGYRATCHDGSLSKDLIVDHIKAIEAGTFDFAAFGKQLDW